ncbi:hypothetical protein [Streptomyces sp. NPDC006879]|uniref:hypothetical protein n=1 Tax=Streptomyces sp. NPDC006879 TaxID=3364767 RepID=UPI0036BBE80D
MAKKAHSHSSQPDPERAKIAAAEARGKAAVRDIKSVAAKTRGMQQRSQQKRG